MSALDRLKAPVLREDTDLAIVNRHDLAKLIAVVEAALEEAAELMQRAGDRFAAEAIRALKEPSHTVTSSLGVEPSHVLYTIKEGSIPSGGVGNSGGGGGRIHTYNIEPNTTHYVTIGAGGAKPTQEPT